MMIDHGCNNNEKMERCRDYIQALEAERCKIQVFQRELPLCLELVTQAIETCKQQLSGTMVEYNLNGQSECNSEQTTSDGPVLEEFIPLKRASSHSDEEEHDSKKNKNETNGNDKNGDDKNGKKSDWLRSVQLWNQTPDPPLQQGSPKKIAVLEVKKDGSCGAFHPFKKEKSCVTPTQKPESRLVLPPPSTSSSAETGGDRSKKGGGGKEQSQRKVRRCWSPELHRRFLQALHQLGGSNAATPKQIREMMKVDGLTNDEVKSHLQKYRLHTRRPTNHSNNNNNHNNNNNVQAPQFVVVGGLWMPQEYAGKAASDQVVKARKEIYTPIPAAPSVSPKKENKPSNSDDGGARVHSPATSSTLTATIPLPSQ